MTNEQFMERAVTAGSGCVLLGGVAVMSEDVRRSLTNVLVGDTATELASVTAPIHRLVNLATDTVGYQASEHGLMTFFAVAALGLLIFMLRI
jgi:hypothetical protein